MKKQTPGVVDLQAAPFGDEQTDLHEAVIDGEGGPKRQPGKKICVSKKHPPMALHQLNDSTWQPPLDGDLGDPESSDMSMAAFQTHLQGLLTLFVELQQKKYGMLPPACRQEDSKVPLPDTGPLLLRVFQAQNTTASCRQIALQPDCKTDVGGGAYGKRDSINGVSNSLITTQFERLRDSEDDNNDTIKAETLVWNLRSFIGQQEQLEDVGKVLRFLREKLGQSHVDEAAIKDVAEDYEHEINFGILEFRKLRDPDTLKDAASGVKRDIARLQKALHLEETQFLYQDEGRLEEFGFDANLRRGAPTIVELFLEYVPAIVIVINALVFGISAEIFPQSIVWDICELLFTFVYVLEAITKIHYLGIQNYTCGPEKYWNWLDAACLLTSVVDISTTYVLEAMRDGSANGEMSGFMMMRMLRLARLARLLKALRYPIFKELRLMVMGVICGLRVLAWAVVMLMVMLYVVGLALNKLIGDAEPEFSTIFAAMSTIFRCYTDGCTAYNGTPLQERLRMNYDWPAFVIYFLLYILICGGVFNLIMALFIDNVADSQSERKQQDLSDSSEDTEIAMKQVLTRLLLQSQQNAVPNETEEEIKLLEGTALHKSNKVKAQFDCLVHANVSISREVFQVWLEDAEFISCLEKADICIANKAILFDTLDADMGGSLSVYELFVGLMELRGPVTKTDIVGINLRVRYLVTLSSGSDHPYISSTLDLT
eukprot:TRINITY_DN76827_c0_g1_i1.p1 TRINITY_DN76827_c0_g1~~TRINITY_DN76827_c0_g1_i1.p1  ORF type:complete len:713 (+),score=134.33 TRINITY_DN76827_c0_g1_i1:132-2270(+)